MKLLLILLLHLLVLGTTTADNEIKVLQQLYKSYPEWVPRGIVDVGANRGGWTTAVKKLYPKVPTLMIEANPKHEFHLAKIKADLRDVDFSIATLSETDGDEVTFYTRNSDKKDTGDSMFIEKSKWYDHAKAEVRITSRLDTITRHMEHVDYLKLDVQGAELMVLSGAEEVLKKATFVQMEVSLIEWNKGGACWHELDALLRHHGFYVYDMGDFIRNAAAFHSMGIGQFDILYVKPTSAYLPLFLVENNAEFCGSSRPAGTSSNRMLGGSVATGNSHTSFGQAVLTFVLGCMVGMWTSRREKNAIGMSLRGDNGSTRQQTKSARSKVENEMFLNGRKTLLGKQPVQFSLLLVFALFVAVFSVHASLEIQPYSGCSEDTNGERYIQAPLLQNPTTNATLKTHLGEITGGSGPSDTMHKNATVLAMASGYSLETHQRFIGSLRNSGFVGNIILAVESDMSSSVRSYLKRQGVVMKVPEKVKCSFYNADAQDQDGDERHKCFDPYPNLKARWSRFPLLRDYLRECDQCTGPVLVTDYRDTFFQCNPFNSGHRIEGLQVFQEHKTQRTTHWLVDVPVRKCKGLVMDEPMLCSGTTIGTRESMLQYLGIMHGEMQKWMEDSNCCCWDKNGDDQSIHNYLFYQGRFPNSSAVPNRMGIVNTVGVQGSMISEAHKESVRKRGVRPAEARKVQFDGSDIKSGRWLGLHYDMTDSDGFFTNFDGTRSCVVHQYDRLGPKFAEWIQFMKDELWEEDNNKCGGTTDEASRNDTSKDGGTSRQTVFVLPQGYKTDEHKHIFIDGISRSNKLALTSDMCDKGAYWFVDIMRISLLELKLAMVKRSRAPGQNQNQVIIFADWSDNGWGEPTLKKIFILASKNFGRGNVRYVRRQHMNHRKIQNITHDGEFRNYGVERNWDKEAAKFGLGGRIKVARYSVRSDLVRSISKISGVFVDGEFSNSSALPMLPRPKDAVSFWYSNRTKDPISGVISELRAAVSKLVLSLGSKDIGLNVTVGLAGERAGIGRNGVTDAYVHALLEHKIVVVAQRDKWEGHYRLMEALAGGALVMTDPMHPLPYLLRDGVNVIVYSSLEELKKKILYYAQNEQKRLEIAARGHHVAMNHHRSWHVMERIIFGNWTSEHF